MFKGLVQYADLLISCHRVVSRCLVLPFVVANATLAFHLLPWSSECDERERRVGLIWAPGKYQARGHKLTKRSFEGVVLVVVAVRVHLFRDRELEVLGYSPGEVR